MLPAVAFLATPSIAEGLGIESARGCRRGGQTLAGDSLGAVSPWLSVAVSGRVSGTGGVASVKAKALRLKVGRA